MIGLMGMMERFQTCTQVVGGEEQGSESSGRGGSVAVGQQLRHQAVVQRSGLP